MEVFNLVCDVARKTNEAPSQAGYWFAVYKYGYNAGICHLREKDGAGCTATFPRSSIEIAYLEIREAKLTQARTKKV